MLPIRARTGLLARVVEPSRQWLAWVLLFFAGTLQAAQFTIDGPAGSGEFGSRVVTLPNGNIVVIDPGFDAPGPITDVGAVYLYAPDGTLISTLHGSRELDRVGHIGVVVLTNGNFVVCSPLWNNGTIVDAGAVTFGSGTSGVSGAVSPANSLVGSSIGDFVGDRCVTPLTNGNYVVVSPDWDQGDNVNAGAVTFGSGTSGISGVVSPANSLVGSTAFDAVGGSGVTGLTNGNYVVASTRWDFAGTVDVGAATFASGTTGIVGFVNQFNSLFGSTAGDQVGIGGIIALNNGSYIVRSFWWDNGAAVDAGAMTFGSGTGGISGVVSPANSLVGSTAGDCVGRSGVTALTNGNYVVASADWDNGAITNAGAATFGSGTIGISGVVSPANSLVGGTAGDRVGWFGVTALANGNYVVGSPDWDNGAIADVGAVTFASGITGIMGLVSPANSLVGSSANDAVGHSGTTAFTNRDYVTALTNGNYVVRSPAWNNGTVVDAGAVTFGSGTSGVSGVVSSTNSLVGTRAGDAVGSGGVTALTNGNYVVSSRAWDNGAIEEAGAITFGSGTSGITGVISATNSLVGSGAFDVIGDGGVTVLSNGNYVVRSTLSMSGTNPGAGAVTFGSGTSGMVGVVSPANSLVGSTPFAEVGGSGVTALSNGNYLVRSPGWSNGAISGAGAITFGSGVSGITGVVSPANSLVGSTLGDRLGDGEAMPLSNGNYVVDSPNWDNGETVDAGAITLGLANGSVVGAITSTHSVLGVVAGRGGEQSFSYDVTRNQLAVGQPGFPRVVLHRTGLATTVSIINSTPDPSIVGQPVTFTATVSATPNAPADGRVTFTASSSETCVDTSPTPTSATTATFSCTIAFATAGISSVIAEYTGSIIHAYSGIDSVTHTTVAVVFADGFESP